MANPRRTATIMASVAAIEADRGPSLPHYAIPLDRPSLYQWVPGNATTVNHTTVLGHTGGTSGRWLQVSYPTLVGSAFTVTAEGGLAVSLINKTGAASVKGSVVAASTSTDSAFMLQADQYSAIGVVYEDGIADGSSCLVVLSGIADVLLEDAVGSTHGHWLRCAATDGRAYSAAAPAGGFPAATAEHFQEIGHSLQTVVAGTDKLCRAVVHFN